MMSFEKFDKMCDFFMDTFDLTDDEAIEVARIVFDKICVGFGHDAEPVTEELVLSVLNGTFGK